ncbi:MAG: hypothetical protein ACP5JO_06320 [Candidatus Ratteibacteria bacterium]
MKGIFICILTALVFPVLVQAGIKDKTKPGNISIVKDGVPAAVTLIPKQQSVTPKVIEAAKEIQNYIKQMSGAELKIIAEDEKISQDISTVLYIGHTEAAKKKKINIPSLLSNKTFWQFNILKADPSRVKLT